MDIKKIGQNIAYLRKRAGFTQKSLAERIGISDKAVSKWERGLSLPDIAYISKLAILLDSDAESILAGDACHQGKSWGGLLILDENPNGIGAGTIVYDKPLVYYLLGYFLLAGIRQIVISCTAKDKEFILSEFGNGERLGINISCVPLLKDYDPHTNNYLPEYIFAALNCSSIMVVYGRVFLYGAGITRSFRMAMTRAVETIVISVPQVINADTAGISFNENKEIVAASSVESLNTQYTYRELPIFFCPRQLLSSPFTNAPYYTETMERGGIEHTLNTWDNILDVSSLVRILQRSSNMVIYCLEEIAWRRGLIEIENLKLQGEQKSLTGYERYILSICNNLCKYQPTVGSNISTIK